MAKKLRCGAAPFYSSRHKLTQAGRDRIGLDHRLDGLGPVGVISLGEGSGLPQCRLTGRCPLGEVRHARQSFEFHVRQVMQTASDSGEESAKNLWSLTVESGP